MLIYPDKYWQQIRNLRSMMHWHWQESCQKVFPPRAKLGMTDGAKFAPILNSTIFLKSDNKHSGTPACLPTQLVLWSNRLLAAAAAIVHTHLFDLATGFSEVQRIVKGAGKQFCVWFLFVQGDISWGPGAGLEAPWFPPWFSAAWLLSSSSFCSPQVMLLTWPSGTELCAYQPISENHKISTNYGTLVLLM